MRRRCDEFKAAGEEGARSCWNLGSYDHLFKLIVVAWYERLYILIYMIKSDTHQSGIMRVSFRL